MNWQHFLFVIGGGDIFVGAIAALVSTETSSIEVSMAWLSVVLAGILCLAVAVGVE